MVDYTMNKKSARPLQFALVLCLVSLTLFAGVQSSWRYPAEHVSFRTHFPFVSHSKHGIPVYSPGFQSAPPAFFPVSSMKDEKTQQLPASQPSLKPRPGHPILFAGSQKWSELPSLIRQDPYLILWNGSIFSRAAELHAKPPVNYSIDGSLTGSGVLDVARELQLRIKNWAYAFRISRDLRWKDRIWEELVVASGNSSQYFGSPGDNWNSE